MSLTRKASSAEKKPMKPPRQDLAAALAEREAELAETRGQQAATAEILQIINDSEGDLTSLFDTIVDRAIRICGADFGGIWLLDGDRVRAVGGHNLPKRYLEYVTREPPPSSLVFGRTVRERRFVHVADLSATEAYRHRLPLTVASVELGRVRTYLGVPLRKGGSDIGTINLWRQEVRPFTDSQIALVQAFAAQAQIAMKNSLLINETREGLEQQKASADILGAIGRSVSDAAPVFEAILEACQRLFGSDEIGVYTIGDDDMVRVAAWRGPRAEEVRRDVTPLAESVTGRIIRERRAHHIPDLRAEPNLSALVLERVERLGGASLLYAPMLWEDRGLGSILVARSPPKPFSDREQALLQTFADQAAIAIENARLFRDTQEALRQQTATSDILRVIASSPGDLQPVLDRLAETTCQLCGAYDALILLREGDHLRFAAHYGPIPLPANFVKRTISRDWPPGRAVADRKSVHVHDLAAAADEYPVAASFSKDALRTATPGMAWRTALATPLMRDSDPLGAIVLRRAEVWPFTDAQIALLQTFADQAVIAIQNTRLFDEVQTKTRDLEEALGQQTATADVLRVISRSISDVTPVFETILESSQRLLGLESVAVYLVDGDIVRGAAQRGWKAGDWGRDETPLAGSSTGLAIVERRPLHFPDLADKPDLPEDKRAAVRKAGGVTVLYAPMLLENRGVGSIVVSRSPAKPFSEKEIALAQSFADQAAIAIQNARMFDEVQARTRDLEEALEQQTATADVLKAISRSAFDLDAVLDTLISTALRLCDAKYGQIFHRHGDVYRYAASRMDVADAYHEHERNVEIQPGRGTLVGRVALEKRAVEISDAWNDAEYAEKDEARIGNVRAMLGVPLLRNGEPIGAFALARGEPVPFSKRQVELVTTFADQAVIAIENVRLFDEVQAKTRDLSEALAQQTATADVLKVISRSAFDLDVVFDALLASAVSLFGSRGGTICVRDGEVFKYRAVAEGRGSAMWAYLSTHPATPDRASVAGRVLLSGKPEIVTDTLSDGDLKVPVHSLTGSRSIAGVPLLRDDKVEGALMVGRAEAGPFDSQQIELLQTFADQAVIAIENARLFEEVQARTKDLTEALQQQTATADVLKVISRSAFDLQTVLDTLTGSAARLCEAEKACIFLRRGDLYYWVSNFGFPEELVTYAESHPFSAGANSVTSRVARDRQAVHVVDVLADPEYAANEYQRLGNYRTMLGVPLWREGEPIGVFIMTREAVRPFNPRQVESLQTFADQAVIAIENVRLFDEVQARTNELAASLDDLRKAQDRLVQSEKLASLGQLTAGIAHEIKNPLNFVNNFSALSRELMGELADVIKAAPLDDARREEAAELIATIDGNLDKVVQHGKRADSIVKNMLLHSREGSGERSTTNVNAMVEEALNLAYHGARAEKPGFNVTMVKSLDPNAGSAEVYAQEMTRVLLNLISNGFYATSKRKSASSDEAYEPTIATSTRDLGHSIEIAIRDNGLGIPGDVKAKMFNPFFTTKPAGEGTGLGLSLSHDIVVKQHGGTIEVSTEPGAYTEFTIVLPRAGAKA